MPVRTGAAVRCFHAWPTNNRTYSVWFNVGTYRADYGLFGPLWLGHSSVTAVERKRHFKPIFSLSNHVLPQPLILSIKREALTGGVELKRQKMQSWKLRERQDLQIIDRKLKKTWTLSNWRSGLRVNGVVLETLLLVYLFPKTRMKNAFASHPKWKAFNLAPKTELFRLWILIVSLLFQTMAATKRNAGLTSAVPRATLNDEELVRSAL